MQITRFMTTRKLAAFLICASLAATLLSGCASKTPTTSKSGATKRSDPTLAPYVIKNKKYYPIADATGFKEKGLASWYGDYFHGRPTSNGERYDMYGMTAAHKILPMNTLLRVRNLDNGKETLVRVNDRGPFVDGRIIDLSFTAAEQLDIVGPGTSRVEIVAIPASDKNNLAMVAAAPKPKSLRQTISQKAQAIKTQHQAAAKVQPQAIAQQPKAEQVAQKQFFVQVGKYTQRENALKLKKRFTDSGHAAFIQTEGDPTQPTYQVHVFAGRELTVAKKTEAALLKNGYSGAELVVR